MEDVRRSVTTQQEASSATAGRENSTSTRRTALVIVLSFDFLSDWSLMYIEKWLRNEHKFSI